jgi:hypothetical protein
LKIFLAAIDLIHAFSEAFSEAFSSYFAAQGLQACVLQGTLKQEEQEGA